MTKKLWSAAIALQLAAQLMAGGDIAPVEPVHEVEEVEHVEKPYYIVVKGLMVTGDKVDHGEATLDGDRGYGFGIDVGYRFAEGFAIEYDFSYAENTVTEMVGHESEEACAKYYTHALDLVYTYEATETIGIFGKIGLEYEVEKIDDLHIDNDDTGFVWGLGIEAAVDDTYKIVVEYEHSTIEGPHGNSIFAGVMYNF